MSLPQLLLWREEPAPFVGTIVAFHVLLAIFRRNNLYLFLLHAFYGEELKYNHVFSR